MANEDEGSKTGQKQTEGERRFSQQQYDLLKSCSDKKDMSEWNQYRYENPEKKVLLAGTDLEGANLQGAYLVGANLQGVDLEEANLEGANLEVAHLENAYLRSAHLEKADLLEAHLENATLMEANLQGAELRGANLQGAHLGEANLQGADLWDANLEKANLWEANLQSAELRGANLQGADLREANLQGAHLGNANLQGADFSSAIVDGETLFSEGCEVDRDTKFEAVALGNLRIYPKMRQLLEYNIRRINWDEWYKEHFLLQWPVKLFWSFSDYGISTRRIIGWFFLLALAFAAIYTNCAYWLPPGLVNNLDVEPHLPLWHYFLLVLLRPVYFSIVTMTTLGFGDMHANKASIWGHALLTFQVILGYILLGALITRFAVLFTAGGPAGKFAPIKKETAET